MPSIVPSSASQDVFLVLDEFGGRLGRAWRETDEEDTDYETLIRHLLEGQCNNSVRVVAFNRSPTSCAGAAPSAERCQTFCSIFLDAHDTGRPVQLPLPMAI